MPDARTYRQPSLQTCHNLPSALSSIRVALPSSKGTYLDRERPRPVRGYLERPWWCARWRSWHLGILASWRVGQTWQPSQGQTTRLRARGDTENTTRDTTGQPVRSLVCITGWSMGCLRRHGSFSKHRSSNLTHCEYRHSPCRSQGHELLAVALQR